LKKFLKKLSGNSEQNWDPCWVKNVSKKLNLWWFYSIVQIPIFFPSIVSSGQHLADNIDRLFQIFVVSTFVVPKKVVVISQFGDLFLAGSVVLHRIFDQDFKLHLIEFVAAMKISLLYLQIIWLYSILSG
jgi:hypothetical protein